MRAILPVAIVLLAAAAYVLVRSVHRSEPEHPPGRVIRLNPAATSRILTIPFTDCSFPCLSPDGTWIAFAAPDGRNNWKIYTIGVSESKPRKVTSESSTEIFGMDVSPGGSTILYDRWNPYSREFEVCAVPASGGAGIRIAEPGTAPRWRPDGRRIGYLVRSSASGGSPGRLEFRSMAPDGSDPRVDLEEPDFPASTPAGFSWAPDGKSVALIRTLSSGSQELFIHGFESGVESQLTSDDAHIGGVCWTKDNNIIYSSSKDGNANIWIVPAEGGIPVKLSGGIGPDVAMNISGDGNAMLILRRRQLGVVSTADSNGAVTGHIPVNNLDIRSVSISPDGGRLAFQALEPDPLKPVPHLYLSGRDGADLRTVSPGNDIAGEPRWSPDGRWIAYCARSISEPVDSERAYLVSTTQSGSPKSLGPAHAVWWLDSANVVLHSGTNSWKLGISGGDRTRFYNDSAFAIPMSDGITLLFRDLRRGREGWWIDSLPLPPASGTHADSLRTVAELTPSSADSIKSSGRSAGDSAVRSASQAHSVPDTLHLRIDSARIASNDSSAGIHAMPATTPHFLHSDPWQFALCYRDRYILYRSESGEIWKRSLSGGSEQRLPAKYPDHGITMAVSPDGTEILYVETQRTSQLILMENLR